MIDIAAAARINAAALPLARERLETMGEEGSGAYNFYAVRIRAGDLFSAYDLRLAEAIASTPDLPGRMHEIGGGFGNLSWLLAAAGKDVICFEYDRRRADAASALTGAIAREWPEIGAACRIVEHAFPAPAYPGDGAAAVITNLIHTTTPERRAAMIGAISRYETAIIDIDRFCDHARSDDDRQRVVAEFEAAGLTGEPFLDLGRAARFWRFRGPPRMAPRRSSGTPIAPAHADILKARGVDRIIYFHTDHFEPWHDCPGMDAAQALETNLARITRYSERVSDRYFARRLTLHYLPHLALRGVNEQSDLLHVAGDSLGIVPRTPEEDAAAARAFASMDGRQDFDLQVHFHHESLTHTTGRTLRRSLRRHHRSNDVPLNRRRFDLGLEEALRRIRNDTGRALPQWFFIHGVWALNASDPEVCSITDEIARLKAAGGLGDFTFPAGRPHCDPPFDYPALVRPFDRAKCYGDPQADPRPAGSVDPSDRFFIWSSRAAHGDCSLDYFTEGVAANFRNVDAWAARLLLNGYQRGTTLYVKTHAHSVFPFYFTDAAGRPGGMFPHERDEVARLIECFEDAAAAVGGHVAYLQASEVYAELMRPPGTAGKAVDGYIETGLTLRRDAIEKTDAVALTVLSERIANLGADKAALAGHYEMLVARERIILPAEIEIANLVERIVPKTMTIVQHRSAGGILAAALALAGRRVISIERSRARVEAQREIAHRSGIPRRRMRILRGKLEALRGRYLRGRALVMTDAGTELAPGELEAVIAAFADAEIVILDVMRFGGRREAAEAGPIISRLRTVDGAPAEPILDLGTDGLYYLIDNRGARRPWWWRLFR